MARSRSIRDAGARPAQPGQLGQEDPAQARPLVVVPDGEGQLGAALTERHIPGLGDQRPRLRRRGRPLVPRRGRDQADGARGLGDAGQPRHQGGGGLAGLEPAAEGRG